MDFNVVGYRMRRMYMAIHGQKKMFSINFNRVWDSLDQSEMALPRKSGKCYGTVERYLMGSSDGARPAEDIKFCEELTKFGGGYFG